jgi:hypothetical protein
MSSRVIITYIFIILTSIYASSAPSLALGEVCISDQDAVDLITLLDASERDIDVLSNCELLVKDLYKQVDENNKKLVKVTEDLIQAKQDVIKYKASATTWKRVAWYTSITGIVIVLVEVLPKVL